jgi:hypothetical protein
MKSSVTKSLSQNSIRQDGPSNKKSITSIASVSTNGKLVAKARFKKFFHFDKHRQQNAGHICV